MRWIKDHLALAVVAIVGLIALLSVIIFRHDDKEKLASLGEDLKLEKQVIDAKADVARQVAANGHDQTVARLQEEHREAIEKMNDDDRKKAETLANDPEALVDHILRSTM